MLIVGFKMATTAVNDYSFLIYSADEFIFFVTQVMNKYTDLDKYANASNAVSSTQLRNMDQRPDYKGTTGVTFWRPVNMQILGRSARVCILSQP